MKSKTAAANSFATFSIDSNMPDLYCSNSELTDCSLWM